ncbi:phosphoglyceromutase [Tepidicaulis marinus]|uniref:phosphoglycerate mutase (2,3-diphosphoglycerate-independent) n=1 Tax=Tepidicaulis marinus TaxID=1333998 RepID=A0A081B8F1_9HYPH|nr:hypothetical protein [Tepidicaulis marinus]GAK44319.1 phosphoglyceromutase [Tepidicaulis marinus]
MAHPAHPLVLAVIDGWGLNPDRSSNVLADAKTPIYDRLSARNARTALTASGEAVGMKPGEAGNGETGHRVLGLGRPVTRPAQIIHDTFIADGGGNIASHPVLQDMLARLRRLGGSVHLFGIASPAANYSHQYHLAVLAALLSHEGFDVWVHAFADGVDSHRVKAVDYMAELMEDLAGAENARLATVMGRNYVMDGVGIGERLPAAYEAIVHGLGEQIEHGPSHVADYEAKGIPPHLVPPGVHTQYRGIRQDDAILLMNLRADGFQSLMGALTSDDFSLFERQGRADLAGAYSLYELMPPLDGAVQPLFAMETLTGSFSEALAEAGLSQLHLADPAIAVKARLYQTGGRKDLLPGETFQIMEPPPRTKFEKKPELAALDMAGEAVKAIKKKSHDVIVLNFANVSLAARTGDVTLTRKAAEVIDKCLGKIAAQLEKRGGTLLITSTYGNAETMTDPETGDIYPGNTTNRVPFVLVRGREGGAAPLRPGTLADVAPTLLGLLGVDPPAGMTGASLILTDEETSPRAAL